MAKAARECETEQKKALRYPGKVAKDLEEVNKKLTAEDQKKDDVLEPPCELKVLKIIDEDLSAAGLEENCMLKEINGIPLVGMVYSKQIELLKTTPRPFTITFTGQKFLKKKAKLQDDYASILKELVADKENAVKKAFQELIKGTQFESDLQNSRDQIGTIKALLADERRLLALVRNLTVQEIEL